jgi:hypothetical protein
MQGERIKKGGNYSVTPGNGQISEDLRSGEMPHFKM